MIRIGVTGHIRLSKDTSRLVYGALYDALCQLQPSTVHGVTCLAAGADQLFARAVSAAGGTFEAVVPATDYRDAVVTRDNRREFDALLRLADGVTYMPFTRSSPVAYRAASMELLRRSDRLFAVWDGMISGQVGEAGEVVAAAQASGMSVQVLWPATSVRY